MSNNENGTTTGTAASRGRFWNRRLRRASFISPLTGERSKRVFTLREASARPNGDVQVGGNAVVDEDTPLLGPDGAAEEGAVVNPGRSSYLVAFWDHCRDIFQQSWSFATSKTGLGILKCSLAYLIGSLATLVPAISSLIGHKQDSKHMVCTVTVWFHPARSIGSMHEATVLAIIGLLYSGFISITSMGISVFFGQRDLLVLGHVIVLVIFLGGGKQTLSQICYCFLSVMPSMSVGQA